MRNTRTHTRRVCVRLSAAPLLVTAVLALAACGSSSSSITGGSGASTATASASSASTSKSGTLTFPVFEPFTGASAAIGPDLLSGCLAGATAVNDSGGVLGHRVACASYDSKGDPADAVPAANRMLASASNIATIVGPGPESPAVSPIFNSAKVVMISQSGEALYDHNTSPYFYRIIPADDVAGKALAYWAFSHGYKRAAMVFTTDIGAQTQVAPIRSEYTKLGGQIVQSENLTPGASSYRSEASALVAAHPDAVLTETDPQTAATFWSEVLQLEGHVPQILATGGGFVSQYVSALMKAIGSRNYNVISVQSAAPSPGPGYTIYKTNLLSEGKTIQNPSQYLSDAYAISAYDTVVLSALAMTAAHSTNPVDYQPYMQRVTGIPSPGATVYTYAQGLAALRQAKHIVYQGAGGVIAFNQYHNAAGLFSAFRYDRKSHQQVTINEISPAVMAHLQAG
jgi:ABC-type branched-subunit amino acid transport system substrate-binding protein